MSQDVVQSFEFANKDDIASFIAQLQEDAVKSPAEKYTTTKKTNTSTTTTMRAAVLSTEPSQEERVLSSHAGAMLISLCDDMWNAADANDCGSHVTVRSLGDVMLRWCSSSYRGASALVNTSVSVLVYEILLRLWTSRIQLDAEGVIAQLSVEGALTIGEVFLEALLRQHHDAHSALFDYSNALYWIMKLLSVDEVRDFNSEQQAQHLCIRMRWFMVRAVQELLDPLEHCAWSFCVLDGLIDMLDHNSPSSLYLWHVDRVISKQECARLKNELDTLRVDA